MSTAAKMKFMMTITVVAVITIAGILVFMFVGNPCWESLDKNEQFKGFFDTPIIEMELRKSLHGSVSFDDKELIDRWEDFFRELEIKRIPSKLVFYEDPHDDVFYVTVRTESSEYKFSSPLYFRRDDKMTIKIGEDYYDLKSNEDFEDLFNQVYDMLQSTVLK